MYPEILNVSNLYVLAWLARRTVYAVTMILMTSRPAGQVFILITTSVAMGGFIGSEKPYFSKHNHRLQMFNECAIFVCCGIMMCFTQNINQAMIETTIEDRRYIGYILCLVTLIVIVVNLATLIDSITWQVGFRVRRRDNIARNAAISQDKLGLNNIYDKRVNKQPTRMKNKRHFDIDSNLPKISELNETDEASSSQKSLTKQDRQYEKKKQFSNLWHQHNRIGPGPLEDIKDYESKGLPVQTLLDMTNMNDVTADNFMVDNFSNEQSVGKDISGRFNTNFNDVSKRSDFGLNLATDDDEYGGVLNYQPDLEKVFN